MVKIKATRGFHGVEGGVKRHQVIDVSEARARQLFGNGLAIALDDGEIKAAKEAARKGGVRPIAAGSLTRSANGGRRGTGKRASSSPAGRAPKTSTSSKRGAKRK